MTLRFTKLTLWTTVLAAFIWCNYFNQSMLFALGGTIVIAIEIFVALMIWSTPTHAIITWERYSSYKNLAITVLLFYALYIVVFAFGSPGVSQVTVPFLNVKIPKQIYNAIFDVIFVSTILTAFIKMDQYEVRRFYKVIIIIIFTVALFNLIVVLLDPSLTKVEAYNEEGTVFTLGYSMAYVLALLFPVLLSCFMQKKKNRLYVLSILLIVVFSVYLSGYFIAVTAILLSLIVRWILSIRNKGLRYLILLATLALLIVLFAFGYAKVALLWMAERTDIAFFKGRLLEIVDFMNEGMSQAVVGKTTYRFYIYKDTWEHFLASPIFGNYIIGVFDGSYDHATFLDLLSCGGIILGGAFILMLKYGYRFGLTRLQKSESKQSLLTCYITYFYLTLFNSCLSYKLLGLLFVIAPLMLSVWEQEGSYENTDCTSL